MYNTYYAVTSMCLLGFVLHLGAEEKPARPAVIAGSAAVSATISDDALSSVAQRVTTLMYSSGNTTLATGLSELAKRDPRYAIAVGGIGAKKMTAGIAHFSLNSNNLGTCAKTLTSGIANKRFPADPFSILWQLSSRDLNSGRIVAGYETWTGTLQVQAQNSHVSQWRRFGPPVANDGPNAFPGGNVAPTPNGAAIAGGNPLLIPQVGMDEVRTTVAVPLGAGAIAAWDAEIAALNTRPNAEDPEVAWQLYRSSLERVERTWPKATVVWSTMPLSSSRNTLRNYFNAQVRTYAVTHAKPLLDIAAIQSTDEMGKVFVDAEGECSNPAWVTPSSPQLNLEGAVRVARAWWWIQANLPSAAPTAMSVPGK